MIEHGWPADLDGGIAADPVFDRPLQEIYNRYAGNTAYVLYRIANYLMEEKEERVVLESMEHVCFLWKLDEDGEPDGACYLIEVKFHDSGLLLELMVPSETVPLEIVNLFGKKTTIPVFRKDEPLPEHPAAEWFMEVVRQLEEPPLLEEHALLSKEISSEYIWGVCEEIACSLAKIAEACGETFPQSLNELEASLERLGKRFKKSTTASTGITQLNMQADIVCLAAQILLQRYKPEEDLRMPWMVLLNCFGQSDHRTPILAARAKVAFLASHPALAVLPNDTGFSLRGPMHNVGLAIREAIQRGVYK